MHRRRSTVLASGNILNRNFMDDSEDEEDNKDHRNLSRKVSLSNTDKAALARAKAAAKVALQDLDPKAVRERNQFMSGNATGCLAVHLRHLQNFNKSFFARQYHLEDILNLVVFINVNYLSKASALAHVKRVDRFSTDKNQHNQDPKNSTKQQKSHQQRQDLYQTAVAAMEMRDTKNSHRTIDASILSSKTPGSKSSVITNKNTGHRSESEFYSNKVMDNVKNFKENINNRKREDEIRIKQLKVGGNFESIESGNAIVGIDSLKNFQVAVNRRSDDEENMIEFKLMHVDSNGKYHLLGTSETQVFDFIATMQGVKEITFYKTKNLPICEVVIDFIFRYGLFGYGYGHQLEKHSTLLPQKQILKQSIFPRCEPPTCRKDQDNLLKVMHVDYPEFLNIDEKSEIGSDMVRGLANNVTEASSTAQDNLLNISENPNSMFSRRLARNRQSVVDIMGADDAMTAENKMDEREEGYQRIYKIVNDQNVVVVQGLLNRRRKLAQTLRDYSRKTSRYERLQFLEKMLAKRGDVIAKKFVDDSMTDIGLGF